jgi:5-methylthioribose kinase
VPFVLDAETAPDWARSHDLLASDAEVVAEELTGGVSASVIALRVPASGHGVVVKQALPQLRVRDEWLATQERTETEADAMRLCAALTPGAVPRVLASDAEAHVVALELIEGCANWQAEVAAGHVHAGHGAWAGATLGAWHAGTSGRSDVAERYGDVEPFEQLRLRPFHETVMARLPELAAAIAPRVQELRHERTCLVHGDYALKNMLIGPTGPWVLDFEVAHLGNPLFDLGFFLSFVVLSAIRWEPLTAELQELEVGFTRAYGEAVGSPPARADVVAHTACLILARTDGKSPAAFLDDRSRARAREVGRALLAEPEAGLWR